MTRPRRSHLFMPGSNPRALEKARNLAADGLILDLEDSVAPDAKAAARDGIAAAIAAKGFGKREILIDLTPVTYVDSATIGCFMDLYRQVHGAGGHLKLSGVQKRVETMLTMTGAQNFLEMHPDEASAVTSFGS